ncbi:MAG: hypothetical protein LBE38_04135 [Deltaproteobacteria bacterium]|nr:hypothetical protein [Deltaproteobacteria bacterium]
MPFDNILSNVLPHLSGWWNAIVVIFYLLGLSLFLFSLARLAATDGRKRPWGELILTLGAGVLLINTPQLLDALASSLFGHSSVKSLSYTPPEHPARVYVQFAFHLIALVGLIGVGRGIILLKDFTIRPGQLGRALTHIFGGILCINLLSTLKMLARTMGGDVESFVTKIIG